jgi:predicted AlkP superfamily pyrophosphatase or phosphodiesterase
MPYYRQNNEDLEIDEAPKKNNKATISLVVLISTVVLALSATIVVIVLTSSTVKKKKTETEPATLILISIDGFRYNYINKYQTSCPNIYNRLLNGKNSLNRAGVRSQKLIPIFPSKTFPNHMTLATGLYAEDHGIVANTIYDPSSGQVFTMSTTDPKWWQGGEPLWVTCEKQNVTSGVYFWPGANVNIRNHYPTYYAKAYDQKISYKQRIDGLFSYLDMKENKPRLLMSYLEGVDTAGHFYGPDSIQVKNSTVEADEAIGYLIDGLESRGMLKSTNIVLVSDHGMAPMIPKTIYIDDLYPNITTKAKSFNYGVIMDVFPDDMSEKSDIVNAIISARASNPGEYDHFDVYTKETMPERYHYNNNELIAPILIVARPEWYVTVRNRVLRNKGDHGYDNNLDDMGALFLANGPDFRDDGTVQASFENINVYSLLAKVLNVTEAPNKGNWEQVKYMLKQ